MWSNGKHQCGSKNLITWSEILKVIRVACCTNWDKTTKLCTSQTSPTPHTIQDKNFYVSSMPFIPSTHHEAEPNVAQPNPVQGEQQGSLHPPKLQWKYYIIA